MVGVILSVLHILSAIFVVFLTLRHLYKMYKKIQVKDWCSVLLDVMQVPKRSAIKECPSPRDTDVLDA